MTSVASGGAADRIAARTLFKVLRAGSGTPARYSSMLFGAPLPFAAEPRLPDFPFFMRAILGEPPLQVHAPDYRAAALTAQNSLLLEPKRRHPALTGRAPCLSGFCLLTGRSIRSRLRRWLRRLCSFHLALQLCLLLRCQHFVQLGHCGAVEFLHLGLFLVIGERSITGHRLALGLRISKDILHLGLLVVSEIQALHCGL